MLPFVFNGHDVSWGKIDNLGQLISRPSFTFPCCFYGLAEGFEIVVLFRITHYYITLYHITVLNAEAERCDYAYYVVFYIYN